MVSASVDERIGYRTERPWRLGRGARAAHLEIIEFEANRHDQTGEPVHAADQRVSERAERGSMRDAAGGCLLGRSGDRIVEKPKDPFFEQLG